MHKPLRVALLVAAIYSGGAFAQAISLDITAQEMAGALNSLATQTGIRGYPEFCVNGCSVKGRPCGLRTG